MMASMASVPANAASPPDPITPENLMENLGGENDINLSMQSWSGGMTPDAMASLSSKAPQAQMLEDPALCGVGLYFARQDANGRTLIKEITPKGSAAREGTLEAGAGWPMSQLKSAILGVPGTNVNVTAHKSSGRIVEIALIRGNPEYWNFHDMNQKLKKDVVVRDKEIEALKRKLREMESSTNKDRAELDSLSSQVAALERENNKLQMDMDREIDLRKRAENMVNGLNSEKKHLEEQIESLLKKLSEVTLSFKSGQSLAREMTEKARQSEQGRTNEEKLRKLAETRETRAQNLLLEEIQRRKQTESDTAVLQMKLNDQSDRDAREKAQNDRIIQLQNDLLELKGKLTVAQAECESHKTYIAKVQEENKNALVKAEDAEMRLLSAQSEIEAGLARIKILESAVATSEESKRDALAREAAAVKRATEHDHNHRSSESKAANHEVSAESLKAQLEQAAQDVMEKVAAEKKMAVELSSARSELSKMKHALEDLERAKDHLAQEYEDKLRNAKQEAAGLMERVTAGEEKVMSLLAQMQVKERDAMAIVAQKNAEQLELSNQVRKLETELAALRGDAARAKQSITELEQKLASLMSENDGNAQQLRIATAELQACKAARTKIEEEQRSTYGEREILKGEVARLSQEREAGAAGLKDALARGAELNASLVDAQALKVEDLDAQLAALLEVKRTVVAATAKAREASDLADALSAENKRLSDSELKARSEMQAALGRVAELETQVTEQRLTMLNEFKAAERTMKEELAHVVNEREGLQAELSRYYSMPNPTGIGMALEETIEQLETGGTVKTLKVKELMPGMSADLSGCIKIHDDILEVDGINCVGLTLDELKAKIAGRRGTKVTLKMLRDFSDDNIQNGVEFMVTLKRGAWGPEHCVMSPEDRDMLDQGRWPQPGALSNTGTANFNIAHIDRVRSK